MASYYRDREGNLKELIVKGLDTLPINSVIDYDGEEVPDGYEKVEEDKNDTGLIKTNLVPFSDGYSYIIPNTALSVDDCTKYIWQISAIDWSTNAYIVGVNKTEILLRVWKLSNPTSGNVTLLKDATGVSVLVRGIKSK